MPLEDWTPKDAIEQGAEIPPMDDMTLTEEESDFVFEHAKHVNALIDGVGTAAFTQDQDMMGMTIAAMFAYAFNLGKKFSENA